MENSREHEHTNCSKCGKRCHKKHFKCPKCPDDTPTRFNDRPFDDSIAPSACPPRKVILPSVIDYDLTLTCGVVYLVQGLVRVTKRAKLTACTGVTVRLAPGFLTDRPNDLPNTLPAKLASSIIFDDDTTFTFKDLRVEAPPNAGTVGGLILKRVLLTADGLVADYLGNPNQAGLTFLSDLTAGSVLNNLALTTPRGIAIYLNGTIVINGLAVNGGFLGNNQLTIGSNGFLTITKHLIVDLNISPNPVLLASPPFIAGFLTANPTTPSRTLLTVGANTLVVWGGVTSPLTGLTVTGDLTVPLGNTQYPAYVSLTTTVASSFSI